MSPSQLHVLKRGPAAVYYITNMHYIVSLQYSDQFIKRMFIICQSLPRGIVVKFNLNDFKNSAADVLRKFVVVIFLVTSFLYLFSFIGKLHVFAMVYKKRIRLKCLSHD
jgi:hypothetical protein